ncbi:MAG: PAS domain S-box protein, partial [Oscillochloris sp.]|nr:PAS domain S-box protein [Oscillochloris sp.]
MNPHNADHADDNLRESRISPIIERQIAGLLDLTRTITEAEDLQAVLCRALQPIAETTGWCYAEAWLPDDRDPALRRIAVWYEDDSALAHSALANSAQRFPCSTGLPGRVWQHRTSEWISDLRSESAIDLYPQQVLAVGLRSGLFLPIIVQGHVYAVLVFFAREARPRNEPLLRLITLVAAQIGAALHRLQAQEAMRAREALLYSVTESAVDAIIAADPTDRILTWNPAAERMFGYSAAEALGQPLKRFIPSRYDQIYPEFMSYQRRSASGEAAGQTIEINVRHRDGHEFPAEISLATWTSTAGEHLTFIIRDISERKRHEAALRALNVELEARVAERTEQYLRANETLAASEQRYRQVVEDTTEVIFRTDTAGLWTLLNPAWTAMTGFSLAESLGQPFINYVFPDDRERNMALFMPLIAREKAYCRHEVRYNTCDGGYRWVEVFARLTTDAAGEITGTCGTLNDITERRQVELALRAAEDQLRRTNDELERRVAERTAALAEANALLQRESLELAQTEQQLRASEERFRQITEHISEVFYISDLATREILYISPSYDRIWGRSRESLYAHQTSFLD